MSDKIFQYLQDKHGLNIKTKVVNNLIYVYTDKETFTYDINYLKYILQ